MGKALMAVSCLSNTVEYSQVLVFWNAKIRKWPQKIQIWLKHSSKFVLNKDTPLWYQHSKNIPTGTLVLARWCPTFKINIVIKNKVVINGHCSLYFWKYKTNLSKMRLVNQKICWWNLHIIKIIGLYVIKYFSFNNPNLRQV